MTSAPPPPDVATLPALRSALRLRFRPLTFLESLPGKGKVVRFKVGRHQVYVLTDATMTRELLVAHNKQAIRAGVVVDAARTCLGNGLLTASGPDHLRQRRLMQPAFRTSAVTGYAHVMARTITERMESWRDGQIRAMHDELFLLSQTAVTRCMFSVDPTEQMVDEIPECIRVLMTSLGKRALLPIDLLHRLPTPGNRRYRVARLRLDWLITQLIDSYRSSGVDRGDLLSMLLAARDQDTGEPMSDQQIRAECLNLFVAGVETTARTMSWVLHLLGKHPEVESRVHAEVDTVLGGRVAGHEDLTRLPYLRQVVTETLRLYPPAWLVPRKAVVDLDLDDHRIPAGSDIICSPYLVHRDPKAYSRPNEFDPDRWAPEQAKPVPRESYVPFGVGAHKCIGNTFASTEVMLWLSTLAGRWRMVPAPGKKVRTKVTTTLYPEPLPMIARRRAPGRAG